MSKPTHLTPEQPLMAWALTAFVYSTAAALFIATAFWAFGLIVSIFDGKMKELNLTLWFGCLLAQGATHLATLLWSIFRARPNILLLHICNLTALSLSASVYWAAAPTSAIRTTGDEPTSFAAIVTAMFVTTAAICAAAARRRISPRGVCACCGYWLAAHNPARCPECGAQTPQHSVTS